MPTNLVSAGRLWCRVESIWTDAPSGRAPSHRDRNAVPGFRAAVGDELDALRRKEFGAIGGQIHYSDEGRYVRRAASESTFVDAGGLLVWPKRCALGE